MRRRHTYKYDLGRQYSHRHSPAHENASALPPVVTAFRPKSGGPRAHKRSLRLCVWWEGAGPKRQWGGGAAWRLEVCASLVGTAWCTGGARRCVRGLACVRACVCVRMRAYECARVCARACVGACGWLDCVCVGCVCGCACVGVSGCVCLGGVGSTAAAVMWWHRRPGGARLIWCWGWTPARGRRGRIGRGRP